MVFSHPITSDFPLLSGGCCKTLKSIVGVVYDRVYFVDLGRMTGSATPLLIQEGWTRHQEEVAKPPYKGADGVVGNGTF
jgi:hypothetical protein